MKILTVSIAAYNVEKFLDEALDTLCDERYIDDIEVLVIDDGSKDNTGAIAFSYQKKYPNSIKYISKENGGHGSTINKGMAVAVGKYFRILDGDDYVEQDSFYSYIKKLKSCDTDVVITDYWWVDNHKNKYLHNHPVFGKITSGKEFDYDKSIDSTLFGLSTLSIKTNLLKKADFKITERCFYVDVEFIIWAIYLSKSYIYFNDKIYMYRCISMSQNSINKVNMLKNVKMQEKVSLKLCSLYEKFQQDNTLCENKKAVILNRITMSVGATYRTYLLCKTNRESTAQIKEFDKAVREASTTVYQYTNANRFISAIRKRGFIYVPIIRVAYDVYLRFKKK